MSTITTGCCYECGMMLVRMEWQDAHRVLTVSCPKCDRAATFDVEEMVGTLGPPDFHDLDEDVMLVPGPRMVQ